MESDGKLESPEKSAGDAGHAVVRAALGAIPVIGGSAVEVFTAVVAPPLERRRDEWMEEVGEALRELQNSEGIDLEDLREDPAFLDTVLHATQVALRNSAEEKRRALRNAVLNSARPGCPDAARQQMYIAWIDDMTEWHLRLLDLFDGPQHWFERNGKPLGGAESLSGVLTAAYPELQQERAFYDQVWQSLYQRGLVNTDGLHTMMSGHGTLAQRTSALGQEFLRFISEPS